MRIIVLCLLVTLSSFSMGSSPVSLKRDGVGMDSEGVEYEIYKVKCDNARIAWINSRGEFPRKKWCVGIVDEKVCKTGRVQVRVAKLACNAS